MEFIMKICFSAPWLSLKCSVKSKLLDRVLTVPKLGHGESKRCKHKSNHLHLFTFSITAKEEGNDTSTLIATGYIVEETISKAIEALTTNTIKGSVESLKKTSTHADFVLQNASIDTIWFTPPLGVSMDDSEINLSCHNNPTFVATYSPDISRRLSLGSLLKRQGKE